MSLVFSAIVPHPPILIPNIGKENLDKIEKTKQAMEKLEQDLYAAKPDIIVIISPHGEVNPSAFTINLNNKYEINFEEFGDFATKLEVKGDIILMSIDKEKISSRSAINIISETKLDHGSGIPLYYLVRHLPDVEIIPVSLSLLDNQAHLEFGKGIKELIMNTEKRVAVVASGDLSHCLTDNAPLSFNSAGKEFDEKLIKLLENGDTQSIVNMDRQLVERAGECGLRSILILLGVLNQVYFKTEVLSYEAPFGVGYLVANLKLE
ncbi:MAG: AmmeMemoRadiSam system protein B [Patescibacteria group bacterium]